MGSIQCHGNPLRAKGQHQAQPSARSVSVWPLVLCLGHQPSNVSLVEPCSLSQGAAFISSGGSLQSQQTLIYFFPRDHHALEARFQL